MRSPRDRDRARAARARTVCACSQFNGPCALHELDDDVAVALGHAPDPDHEAHAIDGIERGYERWLEAIN